jgi:hypothetical protein
MATHPSPQIVALDGPIATLDVSQPSYWDMVGCIVSQFPYLESHGVSGYSFYYPNISNPTDGGATRLGVFNLYFILQDTQDPTAMAAVWKPICMFTTELVHRHVVGARGFRRVNVTNSSSYSGSYKSDLATCRHQPAENYGVPVVPGLVFAAL